MPSQQVTVYRYDGIAFEGMYILSNFTQVTGVLADNDGTLSEEDNSISSFDGNAIEYLVHPEQSFHAAFAVR